MCVFFRPPPGWLPRCLLLPFRLVALGATSEDHGHLQAPDPLVPEISSLGCSARVSWESVSPFDPAQLSWRAYLWPREFAGYLRCQILKVWLWTTLPFPFPLLLEPQLLTRSGEESPLLSPAGLGGRKPIAPKSLQGNLSQSLPFLSASLAVVHGWLLAPLFTHFRTLVCPISDLQTPYAYFKNFTVCSLCLFMWKSRIFIHKFK